jgi:hypothetical protein
VSYIVVVPEPIQDEITAWALSPEVEEELYERLQEELEEGHQEKCLRLAAPSPTFIYVIDVDDPDNLGLVHRFTFYLTYGERDTHCTSDSAFTRARKTGARNRRKNRPSRNNTRGGQLVAVLNR